MMYYVVVFIIVFLLNINHGERGDQRQECMAICFLEVGSKCTVLAVRSPICYLGDQVLANSATENDKKVTIFVANGNFLLSVNVKGHQMTDSCH